LLHWEYEKLQKLDKWLEFVGVYWSSPTATAAIATCPCTDVYRDGRLEARGAAWFAHQLFDPCVGFARLGVPDSHASLVGY
jgi:hypothetical protein